MFFFINSRRWDKRVVVFTVVMSSGLKNELVWWNGRTMRFVLATQRQFHVGGWRLEMDWSKRI